VAVLASAGVALSVLAFSVVLGFERDRLENDFEFKAADSVSAIQIEIDSHIAVLHSLRSLYSASDNVSRQEFAAFAKNELAAHSNRSAVQALEWVQSVKASQREAFENGVRAEGSTDFSIVERGDGGLLTPAKERLEYFPVNYIEPFSGNEAAFGFDLASDPVRHAALIQARDNGEPVATEAIKLVQEVGGQNCFLVLEAVYQRGLPVLTPEQRRDALQGFVLGVFSVDSLVDSAWQNAGLSPLSGDHELFLFDRSAPEGAQALMVPPGTQGQEAVSSEGLKFTAAFNMGGRAWEATITAPQKSMFSIWQPWSTLFAGLSLTVIVVAYILLAMQRESRTERLVEQRTRELSETNEQLEDEVLDRSRTQQELAGLYEISRIFSAESDFQSKATEALERLSTLAAADWVTLRLPKEEEPGLHLIAASGPAVAQAPPIPVFTEAMTMSTLSFTEGRIKVIDDYAAEPEASERLTELGMQSMVILPVKAGERTLGLITVISKEKSHFSTELVDLLAAVGEGFGVLLENSLLHEETERSHQVQRRLAEEHEVMAEIGRVIGSSLDMDEVFELFAQQTRGMIPFDRLEVTLIDRDGQNDRVAFSTAMSGTAAEVGVTTPVEGSLTGLVASSRTGLIVQGLASDEVKAEYPCLVSSADEGLRSWLVVPLVHRSRGIGALFIASNADSAFSENDLQLAVRIGNQIASAVSNAHHFAEGKQLQEDASVLANLGRIVNSSLDIGEVYETFAEEINKLIPFDRMSLSFADHESETMSPTWVIGTDVPGLREGDVFPMERSLAGEVVRTKAPYLLDANTEPDLEKRFPGLMPVYESGTVSFMAVPLVSRDSVIAVLRVGSKLPGIYTQRDLELLERIGNQIAGAIANADLYARQREAEDALREREARLHGIVESAADGIITIDESGIVESFNNGAEIIFGYASGEVVGNNVKMLMPAPFFGEHDGYLKKVDKTGPLSVIGQDREVTGLKKNGTEFPMDLSISVVELVGRRIYTGIVRDITQSKALQREIEEHAQELEQAYGELQTLDKMKDEFISTVSHELRTPLTSIKGAAEILLNYRDEDPAIQVEFLKIIDKESDRLTRLINDVLDLARMESGEMNWEVAPVDITNVIETAVLGTQALTVQKGVQVEVDSSVGLPQVSADPDKLVQVITNLLSNAVKFTPAGGLIRVQSKLMPVMDSETGARMAMVSVSDNGIGIPKMELDRIFGRFQQAGTTLSDRPQGTGLGLTISKEIVVRLGGKIWVESEPGNGSIFSFTVPTVDDFSLSGPVPTISTNGKSASEELDPDTSTPSVVS